MTAWQWIQGGFGMLLALAFVYGVVAFIGGLARELYRVMRYDRHGLCYKCKTPFEAVLVQHKDQMYGPTRVTQGVCSCGEVGIKHGNRRFAEW